MHQRSLRVLSMVRRDLWLRGIPVVLDGETLLALGATLSVEEGDLVVQRDGQECRLDLPWYEDFPARYAQLLDLPEPCLLAHAAECLRQLSVPATGIFTILFRWDGVPVAATSEDGLLVLTRLDNRTVSRLDWNSLVDHVAFSTSLQHFFEFNHLCYTT